jgi:CPA1 family monovalent cation:H+ antiporter
VAVFVLNVLAFLLIGLQLRGILQRLGPEWQVGAVCAAAVCAAVILVRLAWVMSYITGVRWSIRRFGVHQRRPMMLPTRAGGLVVSWCGMRGIVTLATALALPQGPPGTGFPFRDLLVLCAFCVVLFTLVVQGLTLGPLLRVLGLRDDGTVEREIALARQETARAALGLLEEGEAPTSAAMLRREYEARLVLEMNAESRGAAPADLPRLQGRAVAAQRHRLVELRRAGLIGDDAYHAVEEEIDLIELAADPRVRPVSG